jgi:hypothetical protein
LGNESHHVVELAVLFFVLFLDGGPPSKFFLFRLVLLPGKELTFYIKPNTRSHTTNKNKNTPKQPYPEKYQAFAQLQK